MAGNMSRNKGQRGEREAAALLMGWAKEVVDYLRAGGREVKDVELVRNLMQTRAGGYDIEGLDWMALEVKRQETLNVSGWWKQTLDQAREGQVPVLMWRQNGGKWQFKVRQSIVISGISVPVTLDFVLDAANAANWFKCELLSRLSV